MLTKTDATAEFADCDSTLRSFGMRLNSDHCWVSAGRHVSTPWYNTSSQDRDRPLPNHGGPGGASASGQEVRP